MLVLLVFGALLLASCTGSSGSGGLFGSAPTFSAEVSVDSQDRANPGAARDNTPRVLEVSQPGSGLRDTAKATLDYSNTSQGYVCIRNNMSNTKMMVVMTAPDGSQYKYSVMESGVFVTLPLSVGDGSYQVDAYENLYGDSYSAIFAQPIEVVLSDEYLPFLYPNRYVDFALGDTATVLSEQLAANATSDVEALEQIYMYVIQTISYDYDKADTVAPGYFPNNTNTIDTQMGICFDYASLAASMLRAQGLPTKLDVGYAGEAYHAWIEVYTLEEGWVNKTIKFPSSDPSNKYVRMDPTFDSTAQGAGSISRYVGNGKSYSPMFYY